LAGLAGINIGGGGGKVDTLTKMRTIFDDYRFKVYLIKKYDLIQKLSTNIEDKNYVFALGVDNVYRFFKEIYKTKQDKNSILFSTVKSLEKIPLQVEETAALLAVESPELQEEIFQAARTLKQKVYGNRIVIFAPLYIGNHCVNDCSYCAFRSSLRTTVRKSLNDQEIVEQVQALEDVGHKRLIMVYGEHPDYTPEFIANSVRTVYDVKKGNGEIRRVNINAAPMDVPGYNNSPRPVYSHNLQWQGYFVAIFTFQFQNKFIR
jgi:hypothetical protein